MPASPRGAGAPARLAPILCAAALAAFAPLARAQAPSSEPQVYTPGDFARFAPRTAGDMLNRVPGFVVVSPTVERGLGQASGNVLINGQRVAAKSSSAVAELGRIPIQNVVRIEIVDGAVLNIAGLSGQVANVIVTASGMTGQFTWRPDFRAYYAKPTLLGGEASVSGVLGPVEYTLGLQNNTGRGAWGGETRVVSPGGALIELRQEVWRYQSDRPKLTGRFVYDGPGDSVGTLALSMEKLIGASLEKSERTGPGLVRRWRRVENRDDTFNYEASGDFEFALGPGRLKLIGLYRDEHEPFTSDLFTSFADGAAPIGDSVDIARDEGERVARAEYRWSAGGDWQVSAERAFNSLDQNTRLFSLQPGGALREVALPNGGARVQESRSEVMASYGRALSPTLSVQVSAGGEYSSLSQVGGGGRVRSFWRPKGLATAAWKAAPGLDVNLRLERRVGQLSFSNFLASVNLTDNSRNAGNAELVPPQNWIGEVEAVRSLGPLGVTRLKLYGRLTDDIIDTIPIGPTGESPGNIDRATVYGLAWNSTFELAALGWAGAKLDARFELETSRVRDPLTGAIRPISNNRLHSFDIDLRHDVPGTDWAWGAGASRYYYALNYRLTEVSVNREGPVWADAFVEHKDLFGLTVRASASNLLSARNTGYRTVYAARRDGPAAFTEVRDRRIGPLFFFEVRGRF